MANARDRNINDAWQNGGMFEGKPVTDKMLLEHWKGRLKNVAKDDPLYDTYNNTVMQLDYTIASSKASTAYAQGKLSDRGMANFYLNWAKKVPKNSEFYRVLQRDAAQFMRAANRGGGGGGGGRSSAQAKEDSYQSFMKNTEKKYEAAGQYLTETLRNMAKGAAIIDLGDNAGSYLTAFDPSDPQVMLDLMDTINGKTTLVGSAVVGSEVALYTDPLTGKKVTGADVRKQLKALDPNFSGVVNIEYFKGTLTRQLEGQGIRLQEAKRTGHQQDANSLESWQGYTIDTLRQSNAWPVAESYNHYRQKFLSTWQDPLATPDAKMKAWTDYSGKLTGLAGEELDDNTRTRLLAEANGDGSVDSLAENFSGLNSGNHTTTTGGFSGDIAETMYDVQRYSAMQQNVAAGRAFWTTGATNAQGVFEPKAGGKEIGAATLADITAVSPVEPKLMFVPQGDGVPPLSVVVTGVNITAKARNADGEAIQIMPGSGGNTVGSAYDVSVGGVSTRVYAFQSGGKTYYTTDKPWADGIPMRDTGGGVELDLSPLVQNVDRTQLGFGSDGPMALDAKGKVVINPSSLTYMSDEIRAAAGIDPETDFFSPTLAALSSSIDGQLALGRMYQDPRFRAQLDAEAQQAATNEDGSIDQNLYTKFGEQSYALAQGNAASAVATVMGTVSAFQKLWDKTTTAPTFDSVKAAKPMGAGKTFGDDSRNVDRRPDVQLPSDKVANTPFSQLGSLFLPNQAIIKPPAAPTTGTDIKTGGTLRLPSVPTPGPRPTPTPAPVIKPPPAPVIKPPPIQPPDFSWQGAPAVKPPPTTTTTVKPPPRYEHL